MRKEMVIWTKKKINAVKNTIRQKKGGIVIEKETKDARDSEPEKDRRRKRQDTAS